MDSDHAAAGVAHFKVVPATDGQFHWELINPHGTPMFRSIENFDTEDEAFASAEYARQVIAQAPIARP